MIHFSHRWIFFDWGAKPQEPFKSGWCIKRSKICILWSTSRFNPIYQKLRFFDPCIGNALKHHGEYSTKGICINTCTGTLPRQWPYCKFFVLELKFNAYYSLKTLIFRRIIHPIENSLWNMNLINIQLKVT